MTGNRTGTRSRALNIAMVVLAAIIVVAGVLFALGVRGVLNTAPDTPYTTSDKVGTVTIERAGVTYALDEGTTLQAGDAVATQAGSSITLAGADRGSAALDASTSITATADTLTVASGGLFCQATAGQGLSLASDQAQLASTDGVFVLDAQTGSTTLYVLAGTVTAADGTAVTAGQAATFAADASAPSVQGSFSPARLDTFMLEHAQAAAQAGTSLCFTADQLGQAQQERTASATAESAAGKGTGTSTEAAGAGAASGSADAAGTGASDAAAASAASDSAAGGAAGASGAAAAGGASTDAAAGAGTVTIQIRCDTVLDHLSQLAAGKRAAVPSNGLILGPTTVTVAAGDTVFDVLKAACRANGIALDYSYTPVYDATYIKGIGNLYEKDCGDQSGWVYKVNGWVADTSCSQYQVTAGDSIVWAYSCVNYGEDVA